MSRSGYIKVVHNAVGEKALSVFANGDQLFSSLAFKESSKRKKLHKGIYKIKFVRSDGKTLASGTLKLSEGMDATLIVTRVYDGSLEVIALNNSSKSPPSHKALIRFMHGIPHNYSVDVTMNKKRMATNIRPSTFTDYKVINSSKNYKVIVTNSTTNKKLLDINLKEKPRGIATVILTMNEDGSITSFYIND